MRHAPDRQADYDEHAVVVGPPKTEAAGVRAVLVSLRRSLAEMGPVRTAAAWLRLNQRDGFDCPGCAWPEEQGGRKFAEFCENGAKAVAEEAVRLLAELGDHLGIDRPDHLGLELALR